MRQLSISFLFFVSINFCLKGQISLIDSSFNFGRNGILNGNVLGTMPEKNGKLMIWGQFDSVGNHHTNKIARLLPNGSVDTTFRFSLQALDEINLKRSFLKILPGGMYCLPVIDYPIPEKKFYILDSTGQLVSEIDMPIIPSIGLDSGFTIEAFESSIDGGFWVGINHSNHKSFLAKLNSDFSWDSDFEPILTDSLGGVYSILRIDSSKFSLAMDHIVTPSPPESYPYTILFSEDGSEIKRMPSTIFDVDNLGRIYHLATSNPLGLTFSVNRTLSNGENDTGYSFELELGESPMLFKNLLTIHPRSIESPPGSNNWVYSIGIRDDNCQMLNSTNFDFTIGRPFNFSIPTFDQSGIYLISDLWNQGFPSNLPPITKITIPTILSTAEEIKESITLFPNPSTSFVTFSGISRATEICIQSTTGQPLLTQKISIENPTISTNSLPPGIYFVTIQAKTGRQFHKLIKK